MLFNTYVYSHPITKIPFYVGKGKEGRSDFHINKARMKRIGSTENFCIIECRKLLKLNLLPTIEIILKNVTEFEAFEKEKELILLYGRLCNKTGSLVNLTTGGDGASGYKQSDEHIKQRVAKQLGRKMSEEQKRKIKLHANTPEFKARISKLFKGKKLADKHRLKISNFQKTKILSQETKNKISEGCKKAGIRPPLLTGEKHSRAKGGTIIMPNGELIKFKCLVTFCKDRDLNVSSVRNTFSKKRPLKRGNFAGLILISRD